MIKIHVSDMNSEIPTVRYFKLKMCSAAFLSAGIAVLKQLASTSLLFNY